MAEAHSASKARADLRRLKSCDRCGAPVYVVTALDATTGVTRTLPVQPDAIDSGWFVLTPEGAFMDSAFQLEGIRYERHICPAKKTGLRHAPATPGLFMPPAFEEQKG